MNESFLTQISLVGTMALCAIGLVHYAYKQHNFLQHLGMIGLIAGIGAKLWGDPDYVQVAHVGLFLYACGTAWRVYKFRQRKPGDPSTPAELSNKDLHHVAGGKG